MQNYLLLYTVAGSGELRYGQKSYTMTKGSVVFIDCRASHEYFPTADGWEFKYIHLCGANTEAIYQKICDKTVLFTACGDLELLFDRVRDCVSKYDTEAKCSELIYRILMRISDIDWGIAADWLKDTMLYISENYAMPLTVNSLADRVYLSRTYFSSEFKRRVGITPREYIENYRFEIAVRLLETTDMSVTEIAEKCGFSDSAVFIRAFGRTVGQTPLQYRRSRAERP